MTNTEIGELKAKISVQTALFVEVGTTIYRGAVVEIDSGGFWLTEDLETEEYIAFLDITDWAVI